MALTALIFDLDGTLIDSNAVHAEAWRKALARYGYEVSLDRIGVEIGKGGDKLLPSVMGQQINEAQGELLSKAQVEAFIQAAKATPLRVFDGAVQLLKEVRKRGLKLALATSGSKDALDTIEKSSGVEWSKLFDVVTTSSDAAESKPAPAIIQAAIKKLKVPAAQCAMVGDTPYDADSARDGGVVCLGLACGGMNDEKTLRATGMRKVYQDPADMARHLEEALHIASPAQTVLSEKVIHSLMGEALKVAREGLNSGEAPIGCVIALGNGIVIAHGHNESNRTQNKAAHAEMVAISRTVGKALPDATDLILVSTLEPCVMCMGASMEIAVDTILYGLSAPADGGTLRVRPPISPDSQMPRIVGNILADECRDLFKEFSRRSPANPAQAEFTRQLLAMT